MKILYVDLQYDYGKKSRGVNQIGEIGFHQVFKKLGHDVTCFYYDEYLTQLDILQTKLLDFANSVKPDLIYFSLFTNQFFPKTLLELKSKYTTINWFGDDQWRFDNFTSQYAPLFTHCITTDDFAIEKYKKIGVKSIFSSQWAALNIEVSETDIKPEYKYDVSFVGGAHPVRKWIVSEFKKKGIEVAAFGHGWPNGSVSLDEMRNVFRQSKINLNLSNSINYDLRFLTHHPKNILLALRSAKDTSQIKARNFEIPYFGGFQLSDYVPGLESYLDIGKEVVCYSNIDEAIALARYYLDNDLKREAVKEQSKLKVRQHHTYLHRHKKILEQL